MHFLLVGTSYFKHSFYVRLFRPFWACLQFWHFKLALTINQPSATIVKRFPNGLRFCELIAVSSPLARPNRKKLRKMVPRLSEKTRLKRPASWWCTVFQSSFYYIMSCLSMSKGIKITYFKQIKASLRKKANDLTHLLLN